MRKISAMMSQKVGSSSTTRMAGWDSAGGPWRTPSSERCVSGALECIKRLPPASVWEIYRPGAGCKFIAAALRRTPGWTDIPYGGGLQIRATGEQGTQRLAELVRSERLGQERIRSGEERLVLGGLPGGGAHDDGRDAEPGGLLLDQANERQPVDLGHHHVDHQQVGGFAPHFVQGLFRPEGQADVHAEGVEHFSHDVAEGDFVVDDQDA